jgi:hypothetical protein
MHVTYKYKEWFGASSEQGRRSDLLRKATRTEGGGGSKADLFRRRSGSKSQFCSHPPFEVSRFRFDLPALSEGRDPCGAWSTGTGSTVMECERSTRCGCSDRNGLWQTRRDGIATAGGGPRTGPSPCLCGGSRSGGMIFSPSRPVTVCKAATSPARHGWWVSQPTAPTTGASSRSRRTPRRETAAEAAEMHGFAAMEPWWSHRQPAYMYLVAGGLAWKL